MLNWLYRWIIRNVVNRWDKWGDYLLEQLLSVIAKPSTLLEAEGWGRQIGQLLKKHLPTQEIEKFIGAIAYGAGLSLKDVKPKDGSGGSSR